MFTDLLCLQKRAKRVACFFVLILISKNSISGQVVSLSLPTQPSEQSTNTSKNFLNSHASEAGVQSVDSSMIDQVPVINLGRAMSASCSVKNYNAWGKCKVWLKPHQYMRIRSYNFGVPYSVANIELQLASRGTDAMVFTNVVNSAEQGVDQVVTLSAMGANGGAGRVFTSVAPADIRQPVTVYLQNDGPSSVFIRVL
ncbi:hypothetical protein [Piscirickettsia litoralis]|uniref:Uncharacterized protein n=1 Tax=Piscirickettsia litoralis TaxID=1891921 RepID=A0ABX3A7H3_9GAMM|nr:hypothetical protein [Piscirickettsia litoralis]ODN43656.1 hypothetical protein BGC07_13015 [Piscirickettsia litoralis]